METTKSASSLGRSFRVQHVHAATPEYARRRSLHDTKRQLHTRFQPAGACPPKMGQIRQPRAPESSTGRRDRLEGSVLLSPRPVPSPRPCTSPNLGILTATVNRQPANTTLARPGHPLDSKLTPETGSWNPEGGHRSRRAAGGRDIARGCPLHRRHTETPENGETKKNDKI